MHSVSNAVMWLSKTSCCLPGSSGDLTRRLKVIQHVKFLAGLIDRLDGFDKRAKFQLFQYLCDLRLL